MKQENMTPMDQAMSHRATAHPLPLTWRGVASVLALATGMSLMAGGLAGAKDAPRQFGGVPFDAAPSPTIRTGAADSLATRRVNLAIGKSMVIDLPADAGEIFVANPKVANAVVRTSRKIFVIGVAAGTTTVLVMGKGNEQIASLDIGVAKELGRELNVLRDVIKRAMPGADVKVESVGDNFVLSGTVESALDAQKAVDIANNLVGQSGGFFGFGASQGKVVNALQVRGKDQVMLKVTVAEVQRSVLKQLGVDIQGRWTVAGSGFATSPGYGLPFTVNRQSPATFGGVGVGGRGASINTLERQGVLRTLAEPTLTAISGESAKFLAGGEIAVPTNETCNVSTLGFNTCTIGVSYKPIGVSLNFTPVVLSENRISVRVATEVTEIEPDNSFKLTTVTVPGFRSRKAETTVELPSGGMMATAGLIQQQTRQHINGIPGAMNIPILGTLFRSRDYQRLETELLILVQPFIAKASSPGQIARPDDNFAEASDPSTIFMGRLTRTYGAGAKAATGPVGFIND
jgi:pilus assembly protein CpaC